MSEVKRFDLVSSEHFGGGIGAKENGKFCLFSDYAELKAQRDALAAENGLAAKAVQTFCDVVGSNTDVIAEEMGIEGAKAILAAMSATGNMPATDAYLNSVRAEGVEIFAKHCDESIGFIEPEDETLYTLMEEQAKLFAAQLRAGKDGE